MGKVDEILKSSMKPKEKVARLAREIKKDKNVLSKVIDCFKAGSTAEKGRRKPFDVYTSTTPRLPTNLTSAQFRIEYEYTAKADGIYNTTTDISFTDSMNPGPANIRAKLMIWFDRRNMPFFESKILKRAVIQGVRHEAFIDPDHVGPEGKWVFIAMLPHNLPSRGELNLREYFDYCLSEGALKPEWFLSSIEAGSEIASGKGEILFKKFIVH
jgi:hypothetical protein